jgi:hypothetical protein
MINEIQLKEMLNQFSCIWPSMSATMSHDQKMGYVVQLATGLTENGLDNAESIREGFRKARTEGGQYLPSVPQFVQWCKPKQTHQTIYKIAPSQQTITKEEQLRYAQLSKNLLELIK